MVGSPTQHLAQHAYGWHSRTGEERWKARGYAAATIATALMTTGLLVRIQLSGVATRAVPSSLVAADAPLTQLGGVPVAAG